MPFFCINKLFLLILVPCSVVSRQITPDNWPQGTSPIREYFGDYQLQDKVCIHNLYIFFSFEKVLKTEQSEKYEKQPIYTHILIIFYVSQQ